MAQRVVKYLEVFRDNQLLFKVVAVVWHVSGRNQKPGGCLGRLVEVLEGELTDIDPCQTSYNVRSL